MIDLRSDTVTKPTPSMLLAMNRAAVGDDVYGEDPTVNELEHLAASQLGFEAGLYASSGTQTNLLALLAHCERGDEYIVGQQAHTYKYEGGGAAVFGSIQPQPLDQRDDGSLPLDRIEQAIKPDDYHFARTRLLALENTTAGRPLPMAYLAAARELVNSHGLLMHLDGARVFNASVFHGVDVTEISRYFDSVSVCLSKGLCAPVGSVLVGSAEVIAKARRWRKVLGGGMRQAGYIAAAGIVALQENVDRLSEDHENARHLCEQLQQYEWLSCEQTSRTNMVYLHCGREVAARLAETLQRAGIMISPADSVRLVTHKDVSRADIDRVVAEIARA